jgi:Flp pilus assembly protein TadD
VSKKKKRNIPKVSPAPQTKPVTASTEFIVPKKSILIGCLVLFAVGLGVYAPSFHHEFIWDDKIIIPLNEHIAAFNVPKLFSTDVHHFSYQPSNFYRPLQMVSYAVNYKFGALNTFGYHLVNTLIHTANALVLFLIFARLNERTRSANSGDWLWIAAAAALIWLVHPLHTQNVTYISGRADVLVTFFILTAFYLHMGAGQAQMTARVIASPAGAKQSLSLLRRLRLLATTRYRSLRNLAALLCFAGALLSKELAVIAPLFFLAYDLIIAKEEGGLKKQAPFYAGCGALLGIYVVLRLTVFNFPTAFTTEEIPSLGPRLFTSAVSIMLMFSQLVAPRDLSMLRNIDWHHNLLDPAVLASFAVLAALLVLMLKLRRHQPLVSFCLAWFFIGYIPSYNIVPMNANMSEHWMYVPSMSLWLLAAYLLWKYACLQRIVIAAGVCLAAAGIYAGLLIDRNKDFANEIVFFEQLLTQRPDNARAHYNLGTAYGTSGNFEKAREHFELAIKYDKNNAPAYANLGLIYAKRGDYAKAIGLYQKANTLQENLVENYVNLGIAYNMTDQSAPAVAAFTKALTMNARHPAALNGLGIEHAKKGEFEAAEKYFKQVLQYYPQHPDASNNLKRLQQLKINK